MSERKVIDDRSIAPAVGTDEVESLRARIAELEEMVAARDDFISMLGHELRNPLSPIVLHVTSLIEHVKTAEGGHVDRAWLQPQLERYEERLEQFIEMLTRLMEFSKLRAGVVDLRCEEGVSLADVITEVLERFERQLEMARVVVWMQVDRTITGYWDRLRLEQIVSNLISNAIRYGRQRPIEIVVDGEAAWGRITVRDQGIGIAPADQERIFDRFDQVRPGRRTGGFGLGLWIVRQLCTAMHGRIELESELGRGTKFVVSLPRQGACP